ncbi:MAG: DUF4097 domain-containing protein [Gemmatimonadota bacterium]|nr:DUF4097 domain-containing protein [Gemmatimonadota bacterium]
MSMTVSLALLALGAVVQQTDTTFAVPAGARLQVQNHAGSIRVTAWDRPGMRVRADHGSRDQVNVEIRGSVVRIDAHRRYGMPAFVEYEISVPSGMALDLNGVETEIVVVGPIGDVSAQSVEGGITVRRATGSVTVGSIEGDLLLEAIRGRVKASATDGDVVLRDMTGDVLVETVDGDVTLENIEATNVDVGTVDGTVTYRGVIHDGGRYRLTSHDGDVILAVPPGLNATVRVATFDGSFEADPAFRVQITEARPGRRFSFTLGNGSAQVELESFDGSIRLQRR